jgi:hypothetical protein
MRRISPSPYAWRTATDNLARGRPGPAQGRAEEDEPRQKKLAPIQVKKPEDEKHLQGKFAGSAAPAQLEAAPARQPNNTGMSITS